MDTDRSIPAAGLTATMQKLVSFFLAAVRVGTSSEVVDMAIEMTTNLDQTGDSRKFAGHGHATLASVGGLSMLRGVFEPGWRWSQDVGPIAGTDSCQVRHMGYLISGRMHVALDDGTAVELSAGDIFDLPPGHDAWVVGDETCVMIDVSPEATRYAQPMPLSEAADDALTLVERGYAAFNAGDLATLRGVMSPDVVAHVAGQGPLAGTYRGIDAVLGYYGRIGELSGGTFRAVLVETHTDGEGHVTAVHQTSGTRNGVTRVSRGSILFTIVNGAVIDMLELHLDLAGDDAFLA